MRKRNLALIGAIFGVAAATSWFVVAQLPIEGEESPAAVALAPPAPPAAGPTPPVERVATPSDGTVEVRVTGGGEPLANAEVRLWLEVPGAPGAGRGFRDAGRAATGGDAVARLAAVPGAYLVAARAPGLAPGRAEVLHAGGEARVEVDLAPAVALEGRIVARETAAPLPGARVVLVPLAGRGTAVARAAAPPEEQAAAAAGAEGRFRVEGLAPGVYAVAVEAEGRHPLLLPRVAVPRPQPLAVALEGLGTVEGVVRLADGRPAPGAHVLAAGPEHHAWATSGADGRFAARVPGGAYRLLAALGDQAGGAPAPVAVVEGQSSHAGAVTLGAGAAIEGSVVEAATRAPLAGAEIAIFPHETFEPAARTIAGPDGAFRVAGLAPGAYDLLAAARGRSPALVAGITVAAGQRFPAAIALPGTGAIEGTVRSEAGEAMAGARVRVVSRGDGLRAAPPVEVRTGFDGRYRIAGIEVGRAELVAHQDGVDLGVSRAVRVSEGGAARADFFLAEAGLLAGRVAAPEGAGAEPLAVVASPMRGGPGSAQAAITLADRSGNYRLALPAGEYRVHAAPAETARTDLRATPSFARVDAGRTARLDLVAARASEEHGLEIAVLEPGGAPSSGAVVTVARAGDGRVALATAAGEDGRVVLAAEGLAGQPLELRARNGGRAGALEGALAAGARAVIRLSPGAAVQGVVRGGGARVEGFTLEIASRPAEGAWRTTDVHRFAGDRFELGDVPAEPVRLAVRTPDGRRGAADLVLAPGESRSIAIDLEPPGVVRTAR